MVILGELKWTMMLGYLTVKETRKRKPKLKLDVSSMKNNVRNKKMIGTIMTGSELVEVKVDGSSCGRYPIVDGFLVVKTVDR